MMQGRAASLRRSLSHDSLNDATGLRHRAEVEAIMRLLVAIAELKGGMVNY